MDIADFVLTLFQRRPYQGWLILGLVYLYAMILYHRKYKVTIGQFLSEKFGRALWLSWSSALDVLLFIINGWVVYYVSKTDLFQYKKLGRDLWEMIVNSHLSAPLFDSIELPFWGWALFYILVGDFAYYWYHRFLHANEFLFTIHATHHSATQLTPITRWRIHPLEVFLELIVHALVWYLVLLLGFLFLKSPSGSTLALVGAIFAPISLVLGTAKHANLWIMFPRGIRVIFQSPADHIIHHSMNAKHWNKNYGAFFNFWDYLFGTMYVPNDLDRQQLSFGIDAKWKVNPNSFASTMLAPVQWLWGKRNSVK